MQGCKYNKKTKTAWPNRMQFYIHILSTKLQNRVTNQNFIVLEPVYRVVSMIQNKTTYLNKIKFDMCIHDTKVQSNHSRNTM